MHDITVVVLCQGDTTTYRLSVVNEKGDTGEPYITQQVTGKNKCDTAFYTPLTQDNPIVIYYLQFLCHRKYPL